MMNRLLQRWGLANNFQGIIVFILFGVTGSTSVKIAAPILTYIGLTADSMNPWAYWPLRILAIFPVYQLTFLLYGFIFSLIFGKWAFAFTWRFEKKMLTGIGRLFGYRPKPEPEEKIEA